MGDDLNTELARRLRREASPPERVMWAILQPFREQGFHFRRQVLIGTYYADFACRRPAIVIEVDGATHGTDLAQSSDATRDDYFRGRGFRVLRFWNNDVMQNANGVFLAVKAVLDEASRRVAPPTRASLGRSAPSSATLPARGRGTGASRGSSTS